MCGEAQDRGERRADQHQPEWLQDPVTDPDRIHLAPGHLAPAGVAFGLPRKGYAGQRRIRDSEGMPGHLLPAPPHLKLLPGLEGDGLLGLVQPLPGEAAAETQAGQGGNERPPQELGLQSAVPPESWSAARFIASACIR